MDCSRPSCINFLLEENFITSHLNKFCCVTHTHDGCSSPFPHLFAVQVLWVEMQLPRKSKLRDKI